METKICRKCGIEKTVDNFYKTYNWYCSQCKECMKKNHKEWYQKNKNKIVEDNRKRAKEYYYNHLEEKKEYQKQYRNKNKEKTYISSRKSRNKRKEYWQEYNKKYQETHKEELKEKRHQYYLENANGIKKKTKNYYENNKDKIKEYHKNNKENINKRLNEYYKKRQKEDSVFKLKVQTRKMIINSFLKKGMNKSKRTEEIIGMPLNKFYYYLLQTFKNNYGYEWDGIEKVHIDHIKPLKLCETEEEVIKCCYYTNLQLLRAKDNLEKSDKLDWKLEV